MKKGEAGMLKELERDFIDKEEMERKGNRKGENSYFVFRSGYMNVHEKKM